MAYSRPRPFLERPGLARPMAYRPAYERPGPLGTLGATTAVRPHLGSGQMNCPVANTVKGVHRGMVVVIGTLCALFRMRRFFFDCCTAEKLMHFGPPV